MIEIVILNIINKFKLVLTNKLIRTSRWFNSKNE